MLNRIRFFFRGAAISETTVSARVHEISVLWRVAFSHVPYPSEMTCRSSTKLSAQGATNYKLSVAKRDSNNELACHDDWLA